MSLITPREYQQKAIDAVINYYTVEGGKGNSLVVMPTGTGKSVAIAGLVDQLIKRWSNMRFMMLTHVKELIEQNAQKMIQVWPGAPVGIYSAGLKSYDTMLPIIFGGSGSVVNRIESFGHRDILIVDEAHRINPKAATQYRKIIDGLKQINPNLVVVGFTATHFRLGQGLLTEGEDALFDEIVINMGTVRWFNWFIQEGYLSTLEPKPTKTEIDVSDVATNGEDFVQSQLQKAVDKDEITYAALQEACELGHDRVSWLCFASGVEHAEHVAGMLETFGVSATCVHGKLPDKERDARIKAFKEGRYRCIVNNNILTTGFDHPPIDLIIMLRPTMSPGLWVQMLGRGTRPCEGKNTCMVLDFARNTPRLGPINDPLIPNPKGKGGGEAPVKICENCGTYCHCSVRFCNICSEEFHFKSKIVESAGTEELVKSDQPVVKLFPVTKVFYEPHKKEGSPTSMKVSYICGLQKFSEWVCLEHQGFASKKARNWWRERHESDPPETTAEALQEVSNFRVPRKIRVHTNKKYPSVEGVIW